MNPLSRWYAARPGRDRALIAWGGLALLAAALVAATAVSQRSRERLERDLPALRASLATLERDAEEAKRLRAQPAPQAAGTSGQPLASLATNAGGVAGAQVTVLDAPRVRLAGADVAFGALLEWLGNARATHGMRVESARVESVGPGRVRAELVLARS